MDEVTRERLKRAALTAAALAATAGAVWLMRLGARSLADGFAAGEASGGAVVPSRFPAPRKYDLATLVPEPLRLNLGGLAARVSRTVLPMPLEQAIKVGENEARAKGWEPMDLPLAYRLATLEGLGGLYATPDRRVIRRSYAALASGGTLREDFELPVGAFADVNREMTFAEVVGLNADALLEKLPGVLRDVQVARPFYTQFTAHPDGAAFLVAGVSDLEEAAVRRQLVLAYAREGWKPSAEIPNAWVKANLTATWDVSPHEPGVGVVVSVRYSDDEVLLERKENENDEQQPD